MALTFTAAELRQEALRLGHRVLDGQSLSAAAINEAKLSLLEQRTQPEPEAPAPPEPIRITTKVTQGHRVLSVHTTEIPGDTNHGPQ